MTVRHSDLLSELVDRPEFGVLATSNPDGSTHLCVMWVGLQGTDVILASRRGRPQVRNIQANPDISLLIHDRAAPTRYVQLRGQATVEADYLGHVVNELAHKYTGRDHTSLDSTDTSDRVVLRVSPNFVSAYPRAA